MNKPARLLLLALVGLALLAGGRALWVRMTADGPGAGFVSGNGRIEATEVDVATTVPGRVVHLAVREGDVVRAGQVVARMQVQGLQAQRDEAEARLAQARQATLAAQAEVDFRAAELEASTRRLARSEALEREGAASAQELDDDRARVASAKAGLAAAKAQAQGSGSAVDAAKATLARIDVELAEGELRAPRDGRVQYVIAQEGEVIGAGGKVLNLVDLTDVHMTFFLPEAAAGRVALGAEVRLVLDAAPGRIIPAKVSFVASTAQFTPKTVETASERQKLMFRVRAAVDRDLLLRHADQVKVGLPGVAWLRLDPSAAWPKELELPEAR